MASSAENHSHRHRAPFAAAATVAAPPPTPSAQPNLSAPPSTASSDLLSHLLLRLPPSLSLSRRPSSAVAAAAETATPPVVSLSSLNSSLLSAATQFGFFHLADHRIPAGLPSSAASSAGALFDLPDHRKKSLFPANWPLGHDTGDDDGAAESFCLDGTAGAAESAEELSMGPLREFAAEMEKIGLTVAEALAAAAGFESPPEGEKLCPLMWISGGSSRPGRVYPYVVGLHYQMQRRNQLLLSDSGWVTVPGRPESLLVTIGDIAQVWSNGKVKKVRGRPIPSENNNSHCITMSLIITLPVESTVSPRIPSLVSLQNREEEDDIYEKNGSKSLFTSFSFEDYAWRVYHECLHLKDTLMRYRI
ncbi:2-oxoglutarate-dependent dioxygenase DAO [Andrographis paniculata]|uniref:2-oxoglutarate-dependent dioxygenase DAO n=1 Tax=Andrographis paniculata TaxID=175694 RepID=UPI0021E96233|nr:2-oxoglutarate-dependent dioxygenase DAO [Andrographis paniculata]